ncbi:MAG TPA: hypothetical protein EYH30_03655 [Anaerolineales bacterium]|nr:hypothetical protein [Anaerolineae bacterium]HIQ01216.1 hypothetical protein [Anaerolineales bacterium]
MDEREIRRLIRNLAIELVLYGILVVAYFVVVLELLSEPLTRLFHNDLTLYAFAGLGLIVAQGVLLDAATSFLLDRLGLGRLE